MINRILSHVFKAPPPTGFSTIYQESLGLVQDIEAHFVGEVAEHRAFFGDFQRVIWLPTKFVAIGFGQAAAWISPQQYWWRLCKAKAV